jgi:hypothetical protein
MGSQHGGSVSHPVLTRRGVLQAGAIGLLGLGTAELSALRSMAKGEGVTPSRSVIFVFLTGGLSHHDSFDLKPNAPESVRGEFRPIATRTPGIEICEHLPMLARRSDRWALVRSVGTDSSDHALACHMLLTGRLDLPVGFDPSGPTPSDWPSIPALATFATQGRNDLPPAIVLPEPSINEAGTVRPGQYAGRLGTRWDAWHLNIAAKCPLGNGACPECFRFDGSPFRHAASTIFDSPQLTIPGDDLGRLSHLLGLLEGIESQQRGLEHSATVQELDRHRQRAISLLTDPKTRSAFDVEQTDPKIIERYGKNKFGLSLLMARRLVEAGVNLVQVNLGKNSSWDTHQKNFVNLKQNLLPPADRAISALLDDLAGSGLLDSTLVVVTGEFGRTPKVNKDAGRDHWGPVMTVFLAGGGVRGGTVIGESDRLGAYPISDRQTPENLSATMYHALGIPRTGIWKEVDGRPHPIYRGELITGLMA